MKINEKGYWENHTAEGHEHDEGLAKALARFFDDNNFYDNLISMGILDVGCGDGYYTNYITDNSKSCVCIGIDGNPNTNKLGGNLCSTVDVTEPFDISQDWILCLEVGEHIPEEFEKQFLNNLHNNNKYGIILSWAIRGQGGDGHINCLDNKDVIEKVEAMGYTLDMGATLKLRLSVAEFPTPCYWLRNTIMVFRKNPIVCSLGYEME